MKKASQVIGLSVLGIAEGAVKGVSSDFILDAANKRVSCMMVSTSKGMLGSNLLPIEKVRGIGKDYVTTDTLANVVNAFEYKDTLNIAQEGFYLLGAKVVNGTGNALGSVEDFVFDERTGAIMGITLDNGKAFEQADLIAFSGGNMVFVNEMEEAEYYAANIGAGAQNAPSSYVDEEQRTFLLGKTVYEDVTDKAGNVIITSGTVIDESVIATAEAADAMIELIMNAK